MPWTIPAPRLPGYKLKPADPVLRTDMEVGAKRTRLRTRARLDNITVAWRFSDADFVSFRTWFDTTAGGGSNWVDIPLATGAGGVTTKTAKFTKIFEAVPLPGLFWDVSAELEVR